VTKKSFKNTFSKRESLEYQKKELSILKTGNLYLMQLLNSVKREQRR